MEGSWEGSSREKLERPDLFTASEEEPHPALMILYSFILLIPETCLLVSLEQNCESSQ